MNEDLAQLINATGRYGALMASDYPSPGQLSQLEEQGWCVLSICPGFQGSAHCPPGKVLIYFVRRSQ